MAISEILLHMLQHWCLQVVPGCDMAGVVVAKGDEVVRFRAGNEVYGNIQDFGRGGKLKQVGTLARSSLMWRKI